jgi:hypothetical protein
MKNSLLVTTFVLAVSVIGCGPELEGMEQELGTAEQGLSFDYCPSNMGSYRGQNGLQLLCYCTAGASAGASGGWGTNIYTDDSPLCRMAVHAGAITSSGGLIIATVQPGQSSYVGSTSNGVTTASYGTWAGSFSTSNGGALPAPICPPNLTAYRGQNGSAITCSCPASDTNAGSVWGTGTYTDDSKLCRAARHAGVITSAGGTLSAVITSGRSSYTGSTQNGVTSSNYGSWPGSYYFQ